MARRVSVLATTTTTPKIVGGVFADYTPSHLKGTIQDQGPLFAGEITQNGTWAVGGRVGWLLTREILSYWNGGYTSAHFSSTSLVVTLSGAPAGFGTPAFSMGGWFLGGGFEVSLASWTRGLFWHNEFRLARYGSKTLPEVRAATGVAIDSITVRPSVQTVTTQLVYKFGWGQ